ncbi:MAG TPA: hypothetical protein VNL18_14125 [Gemmatimonadales bacterium]|nr:hypothetical protein [Gemmatimonadales bacterium]
MGAVIIGGSIAAAIVAGLVYLRRERLGAAGAGLAVLRTLGVTALIVLLVDPVRTVRTSGGPTTVLLDASLSMGAAGGRWEEAVDSARAIAGRDGSIVRFGTAPRAFEPGPPEDGATRLVEVLRAARGRGGPVAIVSDGEIEDLPAIEPSLLEGARVIALPRERRPNASLIHMDARPLVAVQDTVRVELGVEFSTVPGGDSARVELLEGTRRLQAVSVSVTPGGQAARTLRLAPGVLRPGERVLRARVIMAGDAEPRDDERVRVVTVARQPLVAVLAAPGDWESRFFAETAAEIVRAPVRAFALVRAGHWVDMGDLNPAAEAEVQDGAREASVVVTFGSSVVPVTARAQWRWRAADTAASVLPGDWYIVPVPPPSPIGGRLAGAPWDSVPPLLGLAPVVPAMGDWVGLTARLARRGAERAVVIGHDSAGSRRLTVTGDGLWRWALRGGAPREAYRTLVAAGLDWLLGSGSLAGRGPLAVDPVTTRGAPVTFRWTGDSIPDSTVVRMAGSDTSTIALRFSADGRAEVALPPGTYRWAWRDGALGGTIVVEQYSDEYRARPVGLAPAAGGGSVALALARARDRLWLFGLVLAALVGEWAWRLRRGLP